MTRVIGRGRYSGEVYPSGAGGGGGAGASAVPLSRQRFIDGDTVQTGLNGSAAEPFKIIAQFTAARAADRTSSDNARANFVGWLTPAVPGYVEDIALPAYSSTELRADSMSLAGGTLVTGNVTWANAAGPFVPGNSAVVALHNIMVSGSFTVTDDVGAPVSIVCLSGDEAPGGASAILGGDFVSNTTQKLADAIFNNVQVLGDINCGAGADNAAVILTGGTITAGDIVARALSCDDAAIGSGTIQINSAEFAQFHNTAFSGAVTLGTGPGPNTTLFDGTSWRSFIESGGVRSVGTTVLVEGGYLAGAVEGADLPTTGTTNVSLNGAGATAGYTEEHSGNHYTAAANLTGTSVVKLLKSGGELPGDTILITRKTNVGAFTLAVHDSADNILGTIPVSARGFILAQYVAGIVNDWVFSAGGSMLA